MKNRTIAFGTLAGIGLMACGLLIAQNPPAENVDRNVHPHLATAQHHIREAFDEIVEAQRANKYDMRGHGERARQLLDDAANEVKMAAEAANHR